MTSLETIKIEGLDDLYQRLTSLPDKVLIRMERSVLRKSMKAMADVARAKCATETGHLKASIKVAVRKKGDSLRGSVYASDPHAHLIESGHWQVVGGKWGKGGRRVRFISARPFLRPAFDSEAGKAVETAVAEFNKALDKL